MISSFISSMMAGDTSVRSWINTSLSRSLAICLLGGWRPVMRLKKLLISSSGFHQFAQAAQEAVLLVQIHKRHLLARDAAGNVAEGLPGARLLVERHRRAAVAADDDLLVFRH